METLVLDIQRASLHDGPGLRTTVFLKGCPLRCKWCHNPESQSFIRQLSFNNEKCVGCRKCMDVCPNKVHSFSDGIHHIDYKKCTGCNSCVTVCPTNALSVYGKAYSVSSLMDEIIKDREFFAESGGGVTVSGGEPLSHPEFLKELLVKCKIQNIHTCIETGGYCRIGDITPVLKYTDLLLIDYKVTGKYNIKEYLGVDNGDFPFELIKKAEDMDIPVVLRCPVIPFVNDNDEHFNAIINILHTHKNVLRAEILPYHSFGVAKSKFTGMNQTEFVSPTKEKVSEWLEWFRQKGVTNVIRG